MQATRHFLDNPNFRELFPIVSRNIPEERSYMDRTVLIFLIESSFSCRFGTFLYNCPRERHLYEVYQNTESVFTYVLQNRKSFENHMYTECTQPLWPIISARTVKIWDALYLRQNAFPMPFFPEYFGDQERSFTAKQRSSSMLSRRSSSKQNQSSKEVIEEKISLKLEV